MRYPARIQQDGGTWSVSFPDIPEALTGGDTYTEALSEAQGALITAFEFYFEDNRPVPSPKAIKGNDVAWVEVPPSVWAKVLLLNAMIETCMPQAELARRMGIRRQDVQRLIDLHHATKIDTLANALAATGKRLEMRAV